MKILGLRPMSTWDKYENLANIISEKTKLPEGKRKYVVPECKIINMAENHSLLSKYTPKAQEEMLGKLLNKQA
ncbi:MAG: hypothetical protein K6E29_02245 [Cyanobacteria bacterium RUI128]|nr:hypothetical protein [Cyanobacteria bacterium RUI128]